MKKANILFVCNESRVLLFEAKKKAMELFSEYASFEVYYPGNKKNIDDSHVKSEETLAGKKFDIIITLCKADIETCPQFPGFPAVIDWHVTNPWINNNTNIKKWLQWFEKELKSFFHSGYFRGIYDYKSNMDMIIDSIGEAVIAHDLNRKIFYFNSRAEKLTGYSQDEVLGNDCHDIFSSPICGQSCSFCDNGRIGSNFKGKSYKTSFYSKNGIRKDCEVNIVPIKDSSGVINGVTTTLKDLTELNQFKEQIIKEQSFNGIIGKDPEMLKVFQQIKDLGIYDAPVHIYGETGTGKELVARAIHNESLRKSGPFVPINCGALPEGLIESELFGHVKGSFSGALRDKKGRFELAHKGTIFLDEIGDLPKNVQVKLLRFLQEGILEKVGSEEYTEVDVRIISATNKDLKEEVKSGEFRDDLYYRLNVVPVYLPPLEKRKNDIPFLCEHFLKKIAKRHGQDKLELSREALSALMDYNWPGNVRELENVIEYSVIHAFGHFLSFENLPIEIQEKIRIDKHPDTSKSFSGKLNNSAVFYALEKSGGNKTKAAKLLGVGRATLYRFLKNNKIN